MSDDPNLSTETVGGLDSDYVRAVGAVTIAYNGLEPILACLFHAYLKQPKKKISDYIFHSLTNRQRLDVLRLIVKITENDPTVADAVYHATVCYEICTDNRNTLSHVHTYEMNLATKEVLGRKQSSAKTHALTFSLSGRAISKVAFGIIATSDYILKLAEYVYDRDQDTGFRGANALPDKPPRPDKLNPLPPEEDR